MRILSQIIPGILSLLLVGAAFAFFTVNSVNAQGSDRLVFGNYTFQTLGNSAQFLVTPRDDTSNWLKIKIEGIREEVYLNQRPQLGNITNFSTHGYTQVINSDGTWIFDSNLDSSSKLVVQNRIRSDKTIRQSIWLFGNSWAPSNFTVLEISYTIAPGITPIVTPDGIQMGDYFLPISNYAFYDDGNIGEIVTETIVSKNKVTVRYKIFPLFSFYMVYSV